MLKNSHFLKDVEKIYGVTLLIGRGVFGTVNKSKFLNDVVNACHTDKVSHKEKETMIKIFDYYVFAERTKDKYKDSATYNGLRKKCIDSYGSIVSTECQSVIVQYIGKEFLKVK